MVRLEHLSFSYTVRGESRPVFEDFSFYFEAGNITAVVGPSGCGKTTLLRLIAGILSPQSGTISIGGSSSSPGLARPHHPHTAFIFQDYGLLPWLTVGRNAGLGLEAQHIPHHEREAKVAPILGELGLQEWSHTYPIRLSGGMQQRVAVARALAMDADLILMDEPFSSLDALTRESVQDMLREIQAKHRSTIILVTHSLEEAVYLADRIVILDGAVPVRHARLEENPHTWDSPS
ncbi:MAG: ATP-binding cassette domain-containing protein, partial [Rectinema sp.]|nr:ATP-binding cassette domain-containing protein [Rectinema sp.]